MSETLLRQLENLAALSERSGLIEIKPFRDWKGSEYWSKAIFKMRLCNAGEILDISSYSDQFSHETKDKVVKIETIIRSLYEINGITIGSSEEVAKYNEKHNTQLTRLEYLRNWSKDLEQLVIDVLYSTYVGLQLKQIRFVTNQVMCDVCGQVWEKTDEILNNSKKILYSIGEIICESCLKDKKIKDYNYDYVETEKPSNIISVSNKDVVEKEIENTNQTSYTEKPYICACNREFDTIEELVQHRVSCPEANK